MTDILLTKMLKPGESPPSPIHGGGSKGPGIQFKNRRKDRNFRVGVMEKQIQSGKGKSYFKDISGDNWSWIHKITATDNLANHVATVADYYAACKQSAASNTTHDAPHANNYMFGDFSHYLVASCWRKMHKRVIHWTSLGFLDILSKLDEAQLPKIFDDHYATLQPSLYSDLCLFEELCRLKAGSKDGVNMLDQIMKFHPMSASKPQSSSKPERLVEALRQLQQGPSTPSLGAYTRDTCYKFHRLLIATIFCYGTTLKHFNKHYSDGNKESCEHIAYDILQVGNLLWKPRDEGDHTKPDDNDFHLDGKKGNEAVGARQDHVHEGSGKGAAKDGEGRDETVGEVVNEQGSQEGGGMIGAHGVDEDIDEDMDEEFHGMTQPIRSSAKDKVLEPGRALMFQRWMHLLVSHWASLEVITAHARNPSSDIIAVGLISTRYPDTAADGRKMNHWKTTICQLNPTLLSELADRWIFDHEAIISILENHMKTDSCHHIKHAFNYDPDDPDKFSATYHCEGLLAVFITWATAPPEGSPRMLDQNWDNNTIAVSKLCCPLYRVHLLKELVKMIKMKHKHTIYDMPSFQSDGGLSIASDDSASSQMVARPASTTLQHKYNW
ncbi:hypothetical protein PILCRDRAFT_801129 [Piloderma croceum F 1598]|uniref:Uncharacterized protein n=1 Tax=Piloderma croceum (strain F 1598) TaxID=765440 RepID=A0A0C3F3B5_PILCF|nr:hypothetical protein PILCRDRAFT_801129 [Piloderma croceum F 1598]